MGARRLPNLSRKANPPPLAPIPTFPQRGKESKHQTLDLEQPSLWP